MSSSVWVGLGIAVGALWLLLANESNPGRVALMVQTVAPVLLCVGIAGIAKASRRSRSAGWTDHVEGLMVMSLAVSATGLDYLVGAVRRTAEQHGYMEATALGEGTVKWVTNSLVLLAALLVVRWLTRRPLLPILRRRGWPEWLGGVPWVLVAIALCLGQVVAHAQLSEGFIWLYRLAR